MTHLGMMAIYALLVSIAFSVLTKEGAREQWRFGIRLCAVLLLGGWLLGWVLYGVFARV